jgi:hypothetical protein
MIFRVTQDADKAAVKSYIERLKPGKSYTVEISAKKEKRSLDQNRLYWLWINCLEEETGNDREILHHELRMMFLPRKTGTVNGKSVEIPTSTTALDTGQMKQFLDKIQVFASSELGIILPDPEDLIWGAFYEAYKDNLSRY